MKKKYRDISEIEDIIKEWEEQAEEICRGLELEIYNELNL